MLFFLQKRSARQSALMVEEPEALALGSAGLAAGGWMPDNRSGLPGALGYPMLPPVLGTIPWVSRGLYASQFPPPVISDSASSVASPEETALRVAYQWLSTTLTTFAEAQPAIKTLLLTACGETPSASWMTMHLAYYLHKTNQRVLLIDGDFQNPTLHHAFDVDCNQPGWLEMLESQFDESEASEDAIRSGVMDIPGMPGLSLMPLVDPVSTDSVGLFERLSRPALGQLMSRLRTRYEWILVDSGPFVRSADPLLMAKHCGGVLVIGQQRTDAACLEQIQTLLQLNRVPLLGVVERG
jgi:tyrosine-protein kinase Etk/Wzc